MDVIKRYKGRFMFLGLFFLCLITMLVCVLSEPRPVGGEIFAGDFKDGYDIYIEEDHYSRRTEHVNQYGRTEHYYKDEAPYSFFRVTSGDIKDRLYELCGEIEVHRQDKEGGYMGMPDYLYHPISLWIDAGDYGYSMTIYDWRGAKESLKFPVFDEISEKDGVLVHFERMDMDYNTEDEPVYEYRGIDFADIVFCELQPDYWGIDPDEGTSKYVWNTYMSGENFSNGWWSVMPTETYNELHSLIEMLDASNSEILGTYFVDGFERIKV